MKKKRFATPPPTEADRARLAAAIAAKNSAQAVINEICGRYGGFRNRTHTLRHVLLLCMECGSPSRLPNRKHCAACAESDRRRMAHQYRQRDKTIAKVDPKYSEDDPNL